MIEEVVATTTVVDEDHHGNGQTSEGVETFDATRCLFFDVGSEIEIKLPTSSTLPNMLILNTAFFVANSVELK